MSLIRPSFTLATAFLLFSVLFSPFSHARISALQAGICHEDANTPAEKGFLIAQSTEPQEEASRNSALDYFADGIEGLEMQD
ncbi:MAG TPA: hypothetical protein ENO25_03795, partial [Desulfobacteraceae bacterium]|nr:hypothetical protein [Desulfobacteraceae bacterium]